MVNIKNYFLNQAMMRKVIYSLIPIVLLSVYLFGLRVLLLLLVVNLFGLATEYIMLRVIDKKNIKISEAIFVSSVLYTLTLPPGCPYWVAILGIVFGVFFGKMVFGGFGRNIFNPALVGRCFIYVSFPAFMTNDWIKPFSEFPGGLVRYKNTMDAITSATPMIEFNSNGKATDYIDLFLGNISGSIGETSAILIILAGIYLILTKTASYKIILSSAITFIAFEAVLYFTKVVTYDPIRAFFSGGILFAIVFMATDPISAPKMNKSKIIYGIMIGAVAVIIRSFSLFTEGIMFAILISNVFVSLIDLKVKVLKSKGVAKT